MKRLVPVLAMIAGSVFFAQPASAEDAPAATVDTVVAEAPVVPAVLDPPPAAPVSEEVVEPEAPAALIADPPPGENAPAQSLARKVPDSAPVVEEIVLPDSVDVLVCHATDNNKGPYIVIPPATAGVANGHDKADGGPVWGPTLKANHIKWGDIIEPYVYLGVSYPGQNWTTAGQAIADNGCVVPLPRVTAVAPSATPPTCFADGALVLPVTVGVVYLSDPSGTGPGSYTVTAEAAEGYQLTNPKYEVTIDVLPQLTGEQCEGAVQPLVDVTKACDGGKHPTPRPVEGVEYAFTVGDGVTGPWEITASVLRGHFLADDAQTVFTGDAGDPDSCVGPDGEEGGVSPANLASENGLLPDTGGLPLWGLLLSATLTAAGLVILMGQRRVVHAFSSGGGPAYSLTLPPVRKAPPAHVAAGARRGLTRTIVAKIASALGGGR
ncbi:hypothetical protein [Aeromicrobium sp.]|uniref:hypothetical protein n=1 Tax=Aeromicrobium sp. TaxID=1871063 RepID=UPI003C636939